ncbi:glycerophosphodiester phosphodiesterase family protein [Filibacter tadaridae]|uniref:Putative glycerophosphoryl diester phosphodiesterase 1 n=1 Tax=Filibacter tadaridae TaxID=2483811 RepID=A0A3P5XI77_9BACL|nr:glycerophosphodiester phosphodiesterase family protein [Filibacter tadaridae]VDC29867.1 putative glycerophosphoryl diester phosphodiesterase 1 [Filibacter tadaridae]
MGKKTNIALTVGAASVVAWAASKAVVKSVPREYKKALDFEKPVILAHRGGSLEAPENTMAAFAKAAALGVHGFAIDVRLTKDEQIIVFHDEYADNTTDITGKIADLTWSELEKADAAYSFTDKEGKHSYRGTGEKILLLQELLAQFPHMLININLKDSPDTYEGSLMSSKLWRLIEQIGAEERVVVTSTYDEQTDRFNLYAQNRIATGAGKEEVKKAFAAYTSKLGHLYNPSVDLFLIPIKLGIFPLGVEGFINFLAQLNVPIYFKIEDDTDTFIKLLNAGAAGFVTDQPTLAMAILQENTNE